MPASIIGAWLAWAFSVEQAQLRKLAAVVTNVDTAPVGPPAVAYAARQLDLRICERVVSLRVGARGTDQDLAALTSLQNLQDLRITSPKVTDAGLVHLKRLHRLRNLDLSGTAVSDQGMAVLTTMPNLRWVDVFATNVKHALAPIV